MEKSRARWIVQANNQRYLNLFLRPFSHELRVTKPNEVRQRKAAVFQSRNRLTEIYGGLRHGRLVPISLTLCNRNESFFKVHGQVLIIDSPHSSVHSKFITYLARLQYISESNHSCQLR